MKVTKFCDRNFINALYLKPETIKELTARFQFKGHLGDQDYFTIIGWSDRSVFYELSCEWNRQLCTYNKIAYHDFKVNQNNSIFCDMSLFYWKEKYGETWEAFHECKPQPKILHGNCGTDIEPHDQEIYKKIEL